VRAATASTPRSTERMVTGEPPVQNAALRGRRRYCLRDP
jgi:hypothetical protein